MPFRSVFIEIVIGFALIVAAFLINRQRPKMETGQPSGAPLMAPLLFPNLVLLGLIGLWTLDRRIFDRGSLPEVPGDHAG